MQAYVNTRLERVMGSDPNTIELSRHPDLTLEMIQKYPQKAWAFHELHEHPNFTFEWVDAFPDRYWDWNRLSMKVRVGDLVKWPDLGWNWSLVTDCTYHKEIMEHPELPWDFHFYYIKKIRTEHIPFLEMFQDRIPEWKWQRLVKCTNWTTFKKSMHLPWFRFPGDVNISTDEFEPEDVPIIREREQVFNWIKLTMYVHIDIINANPNLPWVREFLQWNKTTWRIPAQRAEDCIRQWTAANTIKIHWREAISNPDYAACRKRLRREFKELVSEESRMSVSFYKLRPDAIIPSKATPGAVGLDLYSVEPYIVLPGQRVVVSTGLRVQLPEGVYGRIAPRSGLAVKHGLDVGAGVVDPDYTGELRVVLFNHDSHNPFIVRPGYRIAQLILEHALTQFEVASFECDVEV
jgi:dUTP pyrophosphatase